MPRLLVATLVVTLSAVVAHAEPLRMRHVESTSHGFAVVNDAGGMTIGHGELTQWLERGVVVNRLLISFADGSVYDEMVRFTQQPTLRVQSYHLVQHGPSFREASDVQFDRSGRYTARTKAKDDEHEKTSSGTTAVPEDTYNGLTSTVLKNAKAVEPMWHMLAFNPDPHLLEVRAKSEGTERYVVGANGGSATRWLMTPRVTGAVGVLATVAGKQPPEFRMWIAEGKAPAFLRFEGPLYADGPQWRIELGAPRWK